MLASRLLIRGDGFVLRSSRRRHYEITALSAAPICTPSTVAYIGTFWAHRWLRAGANRARLNEMKTARNLIAQAIKIKPNAHFGREQYQIMAMDWIINPRTKDYDRKMNAATLAEYINNASQRGGDPSPTTGLSGLIVLGNAWESVDIFHALGNSLVYEKATLQYLAILRCRELIAKGKKSLRPDSKSGGALEKQLWIDAALLNSPNSLPVNAQNQAAVETVYKRLRTEAETWQARRTSYMMARLKTGKHHDTDKTFWRDWRDTQPPSLDVAWYSERETKSRKGRNLSALFGAFIPLIAVVCGTLIFVRRRRLRS